MAGSPITLAWLPLACAEQNIYLLSLPLVSYGEQAAMVPLSLSELPVCAMFLSLVCFPGLGIGKSAGVVH
ncbi:MAG: hypothetical protein EBR68_05205 [Synechococcaceae bacterium WB4_2_0811]|nr:hypothetical protein [Synechococcaceae bacterium WB4_2_0811]